MTTTDIPGISDIPYLLDNSIYRTLRMINDLNRSLLYFAADIKRGIGKIDLGQLEDVAYQDPGKTVDDPAPNKQALPNGQDAGAPDARVSNLNGVVNRATSPADTSERLNITNLTLQRVSDRLYHVFNRFTGKGLLSKIPGSDSKASMPMHLSIATPVSKIVEMALSTDRTPSGIATIAGTTEKRQDLPDVQTQQSLFKDEHLLSMIYSSIFNVDGNVSATNSLNAFSQDNAKEGIASAHTNLAFYRNFSAMDYSRLMSLTQLPKPVESITSNNGLNGYLHQVIAGNGEREKLNGAAALLQVPAEDNNSPFVFGESQKKTPYRETEGNDVTHINLNKSLIENFTINAGDVNQGIVDFKHKVEEVLLEILNSANVIK